MDEKYIKFKNAEKGDFNAKWDGKITVLETGDTLLCPESQANKFAKDLAYVTLNNERAKKEREALDKGLQIKTLPITSGELHKQKSKYLITNIEETFLEKAKVEKATTKKDETSNTKGNK